jgi:ectoine hydroxylase-related dioxygenase (phytanoyl-CoA dioxygenase family)
MNHLQQKTLPYTYAFDKSELEKIIACNETHGFAVVKGFLTNEQVEELKSEVRRVLGPKIEQSTGYSYTHGWFVEESPVLRQFMADESYMRIANRLNNNVPITLNRSAAIYKKPGAGPMAWHTDWEPLKHPYRANAVLNNSGASSMWFYLNGIRPERGGLAIIPDSHRLDYAGPEGFEFTERLNSFYRKGTKPVGYSQMDFQECFPLFTDPGDLVIFAERTYHGVYPHNGDEERLTCAMSFRPTTYKLPQIWPLTESAKKFIANCPAEIYPLVKDYIGINGDWVSEG